MEKLYGEYNVNEYNRNSFNLEHTAKIPKEWSYIDWTLSPNDIYNRWRAVKGLVCLFYLCD